MFWLLNYSMLNKTLCLRQINSLGFFCSFAILKWHFSWQEELLFVPFYGGSNFIFSSWFLFHISKRLSERKLLKMWNKCLMKKGFERNENKILILMYDSALCLSQTLLDGNKKLSKSFSKNLNLSTIYFIRFCFLRSK